MTTFDFLLVSVLSLFLVALACSEDTCRILMFTDPEADRYLKNHVIQSTLVDDNNQCQFQCYLETSCLSYNLGTRGSGNKLLCELSNSDHYQHPGDLVFKKGFWYHPSAKLCGGLSCPPASSCLPDQQGKLRCVCPANWPQIGNCENDTNECSSGSHDCSADAYCNNTVGSFTCTCKPGFLGDGKICKSFPFHWTLNGSDPFVSLHKGATYKAIDGRTVLYLNGDLAYAETPGIPIQTISFSVLCWIKVLSLPSHPVHIYSDWSLPYQFRLAVMSGNLCLNLRRASQLASNMDIVYYCQGPIVIGKWMHVAFTWSRENRVGKLYIDGVKKGQRTALPPREMLDLNPTGHTVFDIGLKRDRLDKSTLHGYLRDLMVIDSAISDQMLRDIVAQSSK